MKAKLNDVTVIELSNVENGTSSNGNAYKKMTLVVKEVTENEWGEQNESTLAITAFNSTVDRVVNEFIQVGDKISIAYDVSSNKGRTKDGKDMWFTQVNLRGFRKAEGVVSTNAPQGIYGQMAQQPVAQRVAPTPQYAQQPQQNPYPQPRQQGYAPQQPQPINQAPQPQQGNYDPLPF